MNDEIMQKAEELKQAILQSDEYQKFMKSRQVLIEDEKMYKAASAFREKNFKYQLTGNLGGSADVQSLLDEYTEVLLNPIVYEYMNAELVFCKKMQEVYEMIHQELEMDIDFL